MMTSKLMKSLGFVPQPNPRKSNEAGCRPNPHNRLSPQIIGNFNESIAIRIIFTRLAVYGEKNNFTSMIADARTTARSCENALNP